MFQPINTATQMFPKFNYNPNSTVPQLVEYTQTAIYSTRLHTSSNKSKDNNSDLRTMMIKQFLHLDWNNPLISILWAMKWKVEAESVAQLNWTIKRALTTKTSTRP